MVPTRHVRRRRDAGIRAAGPADAERGPWHPVVGDRATGTTSSHHAPTLVEDSPLPSQFEDRSLAP
jgi:hypothetical protein